MATAPLTHVDCVFSTTINAQPAKILTTAKIEKIALYVFAAMAALAGVALIAMSIANVIASPFAVVSFYLFFLSGLLVCGALDIKDYEDPVELNTMREKAWSQSYSELVKDHGLTNISKYRIVSFAVLQEKLHYEETVPRIDKKYSGRQECLLEQLYLQEKRARDEAEESISAVRCAGWVATDAAAICQYDPRKTYYKNANNQLLTQAFGHALAEFATLPARALAKQKLAKRLRQIEFEKMSIRTNGIGLREQQDYDQEMAAAKMNHRAALEKFRREEMRLA